MKIQHISAIPIFIKDYVFGDNEPVLFCFSDKDWKDNFQSSLSAFGLKFSEETYDFHKSSVKIFIRNVKDIFKDVVISDSRLDLRVGQKIEVSEILGFLMENGYIRVQESPYSEGEFSYIGDMFDIKMRDFRLRIELLFDRVEKIYIIDNFGVEKKESFYIHSISRRTTRKFFELFSEVVAFCDSGLCSEHSRGKVKDLISDVQNYDVLSPYDYIRTKDDVFDLIKKNYDLTVAVKYSYEEQTAKEYFGDSVKIARVSNYPFGCIVPDLKVALLPFDVFYPRQKKKKSSLKFPEITYEELKDGTYVVHKTHGIGIFRGTSIEYGREFLKIEYRDSSFLYIPAEDIGFIHRYIGMENPVLDEIGGKTFALRVARVRQYIEKHISDFMRVLAIKKSVFRPPYKGAEEILARVEETFPYQETDDQKKAIEDLVYALTTSDHPIDYLVVGDSGVGKTEVAIRAMCVVAYSGKQVAFISPTTVLALQHYMRIKERLEELPFKVVMLSRLTPRSEEKRILEGIKNGQIDIVIGTHKVINALPYFKDLGMLILDEEHRFGVEHKERISRVKASCDVVSLSATPIPRTLKMALTGLKDISIIRTKPYGRGIIITSFLDKRKIKDVIDFELKRGGQVLYITPYIEGQSERLVDIHQLFQNTPISILHGRMRPTEIEKILILFMIGKIKILVATKIISLGVDIPNVNTMIIERADLFGLSELYQLRGRVGRGDKDAFCYLMFDENISAQAKERLGVFVETVNFKEEGVGLHLSLKDLEMRGAGNLFGKEQVGHIYSVGFEAYTDILREMIEEMKEKKKEKISFEPMVKVDVPAYIPADIIPDNMLRISFYRAFANAETVEDVESIYEMIKYRFIGDRHIEEIENFVKISKLKVLMREMKIYSAVFSQDLTYAEIESKDGKLKIPVDGLDGLINFLVKSKRFSSSRE